jgi:hypothetical protein
MAIVCPTCGMHNREGASFCGGCGARLSAQPSVPPSTAPQAAPQAGAVTHQPTPPTGAAAPPQANAAAHQPTPSPGVAPPLQAPPYQGSAVGPQAPFQPAPPVAGSQIPQVAPRQNPAAMPLGQAPASMAAVGQAAKMAAQRSWAMSKQGMGLLGRLVTGGGRAAYTELFRPVAVVEGYVGGQPLSARVPAPLEGAAFLFAAAMLLGWLVLLLDDMIAAIVLLGAWIGLLALNRLGARRPYFSRLTLTRLRSLLGDKRRGQVERIRFTVNNHATGQPVDVVIVGAKQGPQPTQGYWVRVWGIPEMGRNEVRAWQVEVVEHSGRRVGYLLADRLIPLTVALFLPLSLITVVTLGVILFGGG